MSTMKVYRRGNASQSFEQIMRTGWVPRYRAQFQNQSQSWLQIEKEEEDGVEIKR